MQPSRSLAGGDHASHPKGRQQKGTKIALETQSRPLLKSVWRVATSRLLPFNYLPPTKWNPHPTTPSDPQQQPRHGGSTRCRTEAVRDVGEPLCPPRPARPQAQGPRLRVRGGPVHQKVPVLLHGDRPIAESLVILEYVDETWTERYPLMPSDPLERAAVRFWCHFSVDKLGLSFWGILKSTGDEQRAAVREALGNLKLLEDELREGLFRGRRFFGGEKMGFLDVVIGCGYHWLPELDEMTGADPVDLDEGFPCFARELGSFRPPAGGGAGQYMGWGDFFTYPLCKTSKERMFER
ncbi:hypothetical protein Taro_056731 [Colocasia esculenta]|uniref:glutathione transferase n=1 Tax=Colocasia esculenta TaxID=4460 RepID=A0A843XUN9_COLES|nr:hypothetical protein [Colocasia esculenta]